MNGNGGRGQGGASIRVWCGRIRRGGWDGRGSNNAPDAQGRRVYRAFAPRSDVTTISSLDSRYQIQLGLRYGF